MRGMTLSGGAALENDNIVAPSTDTTAAAPAAPGSNVEDNTSLAVKPGSLWWLILLTGLYILYYWGYNKKWRESVTSSAFFSFLHNAFSITILAVVGVNLINVFLTKLSALKIPVISRVAGTFLPLFHL